jgi:hypothetical protein
VTGLAELTADALWRGTVTVRTGAGTDVVSAVDADPVPPPDRRYEFGSALERPVALPVVAGPLVRETVRPADPLADGPHVWCSAVSQLLPDSQKRTRGLLRK